MSYKKVLGQIGNEVIDQCDERTGIAPAQAIASTGVLDTGIDAFTGNMSISIGDDSGIATCYLTAGVQVVGSVSGGAEFDDAKDNASTLNVYVENGTIHLQNLTGADVVLTARLH